MNNKYEDTIATLEKNALDGSLAELLGIPIIGWNLEVVQPPLPHHHKRHLSLPQSTPVPWPVIPTQWLTTTTSDDTWEADSLGFTISDDNYSKLDISPKLSSPMFDSALPTSGHFHHHHIDQVYSSYLNSHAVHITSTSVSLQNTREIAAIDTPDPTPVVITPVPTSEINTVDQSTANLPTLVDPHFSITDHLISSSMVTPELPFTSREEVLSESWESLSQIFNSTFGMVPESQSLSETFISSGENTSCPLLWNGVQNIQFTAGKVSRFALSKSTFFDSDDCDTNMLELFLYYANDTSIAPNSSWINVFSEPLEIVAIPVQINVGIWNFSLKAVVNRSVSVLGDVQIHVQPHRSSRTFHHLFVMHFGYDARRFSVSVKWQLLFIHKLASFFGDSNDTNVIVHSLSQTTHSGVITWSNESLPRDPCPREAITKMFSFMSKHLDGTPSRELRKALDPQFRIYNISLRWLNHCTTHGSRSSKNNTNTTPIIRNRINQINATVGRMLRLVVPQDTFFDIEDGDTYNLNLLFFTVRSIPIPESSWIQFNNSGREFIGLPMLKDVGSKQYLLVAVDKGGLSASIVVVVTVVRSPDSKPPNVEFGLHLDYNYQSFISNLSNTITVLQKIAYLFGDGDASNITVQSITPGSVIFSWINNTLHVDTCPEETILHLLTFLLNDDYTLSTKLKTAFSNDFNVTHAYAIPQGVCLAALTPTNPSLGPSPTKEPHHVYSDDAIYYTTMVPAVVVAVILLISSSLACVFYRKKRKDKVTTEDNSPLGSRGIPIIFAHEFEDKPDTPKSPVIMEEEKPPLSPPDYSRSTSVSPSTPPLSQKPDVEQVGECEFVEADNARPYQPPPPFTLNRDNRLNRPKHTPTYRLPPPYVPP